MLLMLTATPSAIFAFAMILMIHTADTLRHYYADADAAAIIEADISILLMLPPGYASRQLPPLSPCRRHTLADTPP